MKIHIVAVGTKMPAWVQEAYAEYARRLPKEFAPVLIELPLSNRSKKSNTLLAKKNEGQGILNVLKGLSDSRVVALDVLGRELSTEALAKKCETARDRGENLCLMIGGPDGLSEACLRAADEKWSLSALTLPHPLVRVVLIEQLYRAWTILQNHPYHK
ncbi:MAG: 23S rRNA (pseudouridine(1915)-N(3))-methyltransferase RlmH [Cellvibrionaceae bacterium]|nr:23S rRNA (pseudouridine(1915)-N(3))-methyltransferase RlmH [Cellvibrionaceae bacterium]